MRRRMAVAARDSRAVAVIPKLFHMARRGISGTGKQEAALQGARRMIARGERPMYRLMAVRDGSWTIEGLPWLYVAPIGRREAPDAARARIAAWLDVAPGAFDVET